MEKNYLKLNMVSLRYVCYFFVDTKECLYERVFPEKGIRIRIMKEFVKEGSPYRLVLCKVKKKLEEDFRALLPEIGKRALLLGYRDYADTCMMLKEFEDMEIH